MSMKTDYIEWLESDYPWLDREVALAIGQRLTEGLLKTLREQLKEARAAVEHRLARHLLTLRPREREEYLQRLVAAFEQKEDPAPPS